VTLLGQQFSKPLLKSILKGKDERWERMELFPGFIDGSVCNCSLDSLMGAYVIVPWFHCRVSVYCGLIIYIFYIGLHCDGSLMKVIRVVCAGQYTARER
jgi:hypothetical protein